jgi:hypothetical protein
MSGVESFLGTGPLERRRKVKTTFVAVATLFLLGCGTARRPSETKVTVGVRDATELYGFRSIPVHLACAGAGEPTSQTTDDHGMVHFRAIPGSSCVIEATWKGQHFSDEHFSYSFVARPGTLKLMLVSRFAFITEGGSVERPMRAHRVYPHE